MRAFPSRSDRGPRTKESSAPSTAKKTGAELARESPKGSAPSVAPSRRETVPVPVLAIDADAGVPPKIREAGSALVWLCQDDRDEDVTGLAMDARNALAEAVDRALGSPVGDAASVLTDIAVRHVVSSLTAEAVLVLVQTKPELVLEARRRVEKARAAR